MATKKKPVQSKEITVKPAKTKAPLPYAVGDLVTFTDRSGKPTSIGVVNEVYAKHMMVYARPSDRVKAPIKIVYADHDVRATLPTDAAAIQLRNLKRVVTNLGEDSLDSEALAAIGPILGAWQGRKNRRDRRLNASLRVALISGQPVRVLSIVIKGHPHIDSMVMDSLLLAIGATDTSVGMTRHVQRTPTRADSIDAIVLREACPPHGCDFAAMFDKVDSAVGFIDGVDLRKEIIDAAERCGRMPGRDNPVVLQTWEGEVHSGLVVTS